MSESSDVRGPAGHRGRILLLDDDRAMCDTLVRGLSRRDFAVEAFTSAIETLSRLASEEFDVLVTDLHMKEMSGFEVAERALRIRPGLPVVMVTAFGNLESAVAAIRAGAYDFITKPFEVDAVALVLERAIEHRRLRDEVKRLRDVVQHRESTSELLGESPPVRRLHELLHRVAASDATVLVTGESGTGKELVARALHRLGKRRGGPFIAINCAALPETLLESELFGHVKGAFTDARADRPGLFVKAHGGTLFLDEVAEMPLTMQAKLLRALEERSVRPVGSEREIAFDVRIVAATHRDLERAVEEQRFREDLFFRLNVIRVDVPPLRSRGRDILLLAQEFLAQARSTMGKDVVGIAPDAAKALLAYRFPGNVRELRNSIEHAVALTSYDHITLEDLPDRLRSEERANVLVASDDPEELVPLEEVERRYVLRVLEAVSGHRSRAAQILGLDRKTLYRKLERWGMLE